MEDLDEIDYDISVGQLLSLLFQSKLPKIEEEKTIRLDKKIVGCLDSMSVEFISFFLTDVNLNYAQLLRNSIKEMRKVNGLPSQKKHHDPKNSRRLY